jgi:NADH-quinone oxidoreductase subunit J
MTAHEVAFAIVAAIGTIAALRLVTSKNVVHAALWLVLTLGMVAGVYLLLAAEFLIWVQVLIYVGAIVVLLLFSLMLTRAPIGREALDNQQRGQSALVALLMFGTLGYLLWDTFNGETITTPQVGTASSLGISIFTKFVLPFEVVSFLLLAALIGAVVLARKDQP